MAPLFSYASELKNDEDVLFIPNIAYVKDDQLIVKVGAWVYEKEPRMGMNTLLLKYMGVSKSALSSKTLDYFESQTRLIKVDSERYKQLTIRFQNGEERALQKTDRTGRSDNIFSFPLAQKAQLMDRDNQIIFTLVDRPSVQGSALFYNDAGYLILSDIDDTIKDSNVLDTKELIKNTFLYPPKVVQNAPAFFQKLKQQYNDAMFVYLSSSPIQLYPTLNTFINDHFPKGVLILRNSTAWNELIASKKASYDHKIENIRQLLEAFPNKKAILIGDSGESDIAIYFEIAMHYPMQVEKIIIRLLDDSHLDKFPFNPREIENPLLQIIEQSY